MISRRKLLEIGAAAGAAATGAQAAGQLPRFNFAAQIANPADALKGRIIYKDESNYEIYRRGATWNARKPNRYPNAIVLAESVDDVIAAVKLAKQRGWQVATRSGGHSFTGSHTRDNAILINISKMKELKVDTKARTAVASPGWFGDELNKELAKDQLIATTAHDPKVGIGGFFMCGGHSTIGRMYGPACANLLAADVVTADGELIHVDDKQNTDYFWAIRGGGPGFFGAAVRYYIQLHPMPTHRRRSGWSFDIDQFEPIAMWLGKHQNALPKYVEVAFTGRTADGKPSLGLGCTINGASDAEVETGFKLFKECPVLGKAKTSRENFEPGPGGGGIIPGSRQVLDGVWSSAPPEKVIEAGRDAFTKLPTPQSFMLWLHWGPPHKLPDMAYSLQADTYFSPNAIYYDEKDDARCAAWAKEVVDKFKPISVGSQMNDENMPSNNGPYLSKAAAEKLERLRKKYDPDKRFAGFLGAPRPA